MLDNGEPFAVAALLGELSKALKSSLIGGFLARGLGKQSLGNNREKCLMTLANRHKVYDETERTQNELTNSTARLSSRTTSLNPAEAS